MNQIAEILNRDFFPLKPNYTKKDLQGFLTPHFESKGVLDEHMLKAFTHKSFANESALDLDDNEKLEFMGDAVLQLVITEKLFTLFPEESEGNLSKLRSFLVNEKTLAQIARILELDQFILLGKGELKEGGFQKDSILANAYEAYIAAVYISSGMMTASKLIIDSFERLSAKEAQDYFSLRMLTHFDPKTRLQEITLKSFQQVPTYKAQATSEGFKLSCWLGDRLLGELEHRSKKEGTQILAKNIILNMEKKTC